MRKLFNILKSYIGLLLDSGSDTSEKKREVSDGRSELSELSGHSKESLRAGHVGVHLCADMTLLLAVVDQLATHSLQQQQQQQHVVTAAPPPATATADKRQVSRITCNSFSCALCLSFIYHVIFIMQH